MMSRTHHHGSWHRASLALAAALAVLAVASSTSRAGEIVPSLGLSKAVDGSGDAKPFGGLAVRGGLGPALMSEIAVGYRSESRFDDQLRVRTWPVTASLYLKPVPQLYAGAGVGWYHTTFDYRSTLLADETHEDFGVHLGGGLQVPLGPSAALDLGGRYVMLRDQRSRLVPERFDPDFWMSSLGIAFKY